MSGFLAQDRRRFLNAAVEDTLRWCARPDATVIGNHPTDQFWIQAFAPTSPEVDAQTARRFLATLKLASGWDYEAVAELINGLRTVATFLPERDVPALADALRRAQDQEIECTVAASKLAQAMFPAAAVHVWHDLALQSVLQGRYGSRPYAQDYSGYHAGCRRIFEQEMARSDFVQAAELVTGLLRAIPGPLADHAVPDAFFQRYLLDKLLFHQGWHLKYGRVARSEALETGLEIIPPRAGLYERLRSYIRLGGTEVTA